MKKIKISNSVKDEQLHKFRLNSKTLIFSSKRHAKCFMAETSRYLTKVLVISSDILTETYTHYRMFWFISINSGSGTITNYESEVAEVKRNLQFAESVFESFSSQTYGNSKDRFFSFINLQKTFKGLEAALIILIEFYKKRNYTKDFYQCQCTLDRCMSARKKLEAWGEEHEEPIPDYNKMFEKKEKPEPYRKMLSKL